MRSITSEPRTVSGRAAEDQGTVPNRADGRPSGDRRALIVTVTIREGKGLTLFHRRGSWATHVFAARDPDVKSMIPRD